MSYFELARRWERWKLHVFGQINRAGLPLVLVGKAPAVNPAFLERLTVPVSYICDNDPRKRGQRLWGLEIVAPEDCPWLYQAYNALILVPFERELSRQLRGLAVPPREIFRLDLYFERGDSAAYFEAERERIAALCARLADDASRQTLHAVLRYRVCRDPALLAPIALMRKQQYFPPALGGRPFLSGREVFVDAGAFVGDSIQAFLKATRRRYRGIFALEPDSKNFCQMAATLAGVPRAYCMQCGVGERRETVRFLSSDSGSRVDETGGETVCFDRLDRLLGGQPVTYLKMDVEGMECRALHGAREIIGRYHPKLAVCTYHSDADMLDVPELIGRLDSSYRLYLRHYSPGIVETVCYAV